jgi:D-serine dehydratase
MKGYKMKTVQLDQLKQQFPLIQTLQDYQETFWFNPHRYPLNEALAKVGLSRTGCKRSRSKASAFRTLFGKSLS